MNFQRIVLAIAVIGLIISLVVVGVMLSKMYYGEEWPPQISTCPDYWVDLSPEQTGAKCYNAHRLGKCNLPSPGNPNTMDFNVPPYTDPTNGTCAKYKWTRMCGTTWSGIQASDCETSTSDT